MNSTLTSRPLVFLWVTLLFLAPGQQSLRADTLFTVSSLQLTQVDTLNGISTDIGSNGLDNNIGSLAFDTNSEVLFGLSGNGLVVVDRGNGISTFVGRTELPGQSIIAYDSDLDRLIAFVDSDNSLAVLNPETLELTSISSTNSLGASINIQGLTYDSSTSTLYGIDARIGSFLVAIDTNTGTASTVGGLGGSFGMTSNTTGLAYDATSDTLFAIEDTGGGFELLSLDRTTGAASLVAAQSGVLTVRGLEFAPPVTGVPEPSGTCVIVLCACISAMIRRRENAITIRCTRRHLRHRVKSLAEF